MKHLSDNFSKNEKLLDKTLSKNALLSKSQDPK